jgi:hypothetical protein
MTKRKRSAVDVDGVVPGGSALEANPKKKSVESSKSTATTPANESRGKLHKKVSSLGGFSSSYEITDEEHDTAVRLLREVNWGKCQNTSRRNVIRNGDPKTPRNSMGKEYCHSFIFGKNMKDSTGGLSYWSTEYEELYAFFQALIHRVHPEHHYTNITVNKNLVCKKHTDGGNTGRSYIISFGKFTGGRLIIEKKGGGDPRPVDIYRKFVAFEGSLQPHETEAYEGERYSAVFYASSIVPTETAPRKRPASLLSGVGGVGAAGGGADGSAGGAPGADAGTLAMKQKFQDMKKKLQGKAGR